MDFIVYNIAGQTMLQTEISQIKRKIVCIGRLKCRSIVFETRVTEADCVTVPVEFNWWDRWLKMKNKLAVHLQGFE